MRYEQPIPFYMAYPFLLPLDQEQAQEKDLQVMKSFYSRRAARIQEKADRECDRMEYDGSMMFDEYPDKFMMEHLCRKIEQEVLKEEEGNTSVLIIEETCQGGTGKLRKQKRGRGTPGSDRSDLIQRDVSQTESSQKTEKILLTEL